MWPLGETYSRKRSSVEGDSLRAFRGAAAGRTAAVGWTIINPVGRRLPSRGKLGQEASMEFISPRQHDIHQAIDVSSLLSVSS